MNCEWDKHDWVETGKTLGGTSYKCQKCPALMAIGPGVIEKEKTFEERVIETVVADLNAHGKIRMAILGI